MKFMFLHPFLVVFGTAMMTHFAKGIGKPVVQREMRYSNSFNLGNPSLFFQDGDEDLLEVPVENDNTDNGDLQFSHHFDSAGFAGKRDVTLGRFGKRSVDPEDAPDSQDESSSEESDDTDNREKRAANFLRYGRSQEPSDKRSANFLRFGKSANFLRFGRGGANFLRFGKRGANFLRFGKRDGDGSSTSTYLRFGKRLAGHQMPYQWMSKFHNDPQVRTDGFAIDGVKRSANFLRFGKRNNPYGYRMKRATGEDSDSSEINKREVETAGSDNPMLDRFVMYGKRGEDSQSEGVYSNEPEKKMGFLKSNKIGSQYKNALKSLYGPDKRGNRFELSQPDYGFSPLGKRYGQVGDGQMYSAYGKRYGNADPGSLRFGKRGDEVREQRRADAEPGALRFG